MHRLKICAAAAAMCLAVAANAGPVVTANTNATALANAIGGTGITISNAVYTTDTPGGTGVGTFTGGASTVGFDAGIALTSGTVNCIPGPNNQADCTGGGTFSSLQFDFTSTTGQVAFQYVFGSEEYNEFVNAGVNDSFQLLLNGINIALLPGAGGPVTIDNINCGSNSAFYRNNSAGGGAGCVNQNLDIQYDGLTVVLTASASGLVGTNTFKFIVSDVGDSDLDSGVFIKAGSFTNTVPEPGSLALIGLALAGLAAGRRKSKA